MIKMRTEEFCILSTVVIGVVNPEPATHDKSATCKQLGSGWDAELFGVSSRSKIYDTETTFSTTMGDIELL